MGGAGGWLWLGLRLGFRFLQFPVVVVGQLDLLGGTLPNLPVPIFYATTACRRCRRLRCRIYDVNLRRSDEEVVRYRAIVVDYHQMNDTLNRFFSLGKQYFENLDL